MGNDAFLDNCDIIDWEENYCYNERNQLTEKRTLSGIREYLYNENGSLVREKEGEKTARYRYDLLNRQMHVKTLDGKEQENLYDGEGLRAGLKENGKASTFVFKDGEILAECDGNGVPAKRHVRGLGLSYVQTMDDGAYHAYHHDEQGSTVYLTGNSGGVEHYYSYDAFGNVLEKKEDIQSRILYTGQQYDQETGQYYLRARYYNPLIGRFTQEDIYRGDGLNLYAYCGNNPVMYYDSSGYNEIRNCPPTNQAHYDEQRRTSEGGTGFEGEIGSGGKAEADFVVAPGGVVYTAEDYAKMTDFERPSTLYHYTTEDGMQGIINSESMHPSIKTSTTKDARMGSGQYLTDIVPGSKTAGQTSRSLFGVPWNTNKVSNYVEIDVSDLNVLKGRDGVYYIPGDIDLDLTDKIVSFGKVGG